MENQQPDAWYYSHESERTGPVTFEELQEKAKQGALNPRLDLVWMSGMTDWTKAGEVDGLFEKKNPMATAETLASTPDPNEPPELESAADRRAGQGDWPGARRRGYILVPIIFAIAWSIGLEFGKPHLTGLLEPSLLEKAVMALSAVPAVVAIYFALQRLVNLGMSRWWFLGNLVPLLNLWIGYRCFACPAGYALHKKMDGIGIALAIVYWLGLLLLLVAVAVTVVALGNPELQQKLDEMIRQAVAAGKLPQ